MVEDLLDILLEGFKKVTWARRLLDVKGPGDTPPRKEVSEIECSHPLYARPGPINEETGKQRMIIYHPLQLLNKKYDDIVMLPCGKCIACRLSASKRWADRMMLELPYHDPSACWFVTLTYNDAHVPVRGYADPDTGEYIPSLSLCKKDFQNFIKRCRKYIDKNNYSGTFCYYGAGEYGSDTLRPHYHAILFDLPLPDAKLHSISGDGFQYYTSQEFADRWSVYRCDPKEDPVVVERGPYYDPIGNVLLCKVTPETCGYVARYTSKKLRNNDAWKKIYGKVPDFLYYKDVYDYFGLEPEFSVMSLKHVIGKRYYEEHPDLIHKKYVFIGTEKGSVKIPIPKAYNRYFEIDFPEYYDILRKQRKELSEVSFKNALAGTSLSDSEYREVMEKNLEARTKILKRNKI